MGRNATLVCDSHEAETMLVRGKERPGLYGFIDDHAGCTVRVLDDYATEEEAPEHYKDDFEKYYPDLKEHNGGQDG